MWSDLALPPAPSFAVEPGDLLVIAKDGRQVRYLVMEKRPEGDGWSWTLDLLADPEDAYR